MTTTVIHLLRHGEVHNPDGILYGCLPDFHLSDSGQAMAIKVAEHLSGADVVQVISSPLERAQETAAPVAERFGLTVRVDPRLIEAGNSFEGSRFAVGDGALRRPGNWWRLRNPFRPSWGEPYLEVARRMLAAIVDAREAAAGHEAVLVSHQLPIWTIRRLVERRRLWHDPRHRQCGLASLTSFTYDDRRLVSVSYIEPAGPSGAAVPGA